MEIELCGVINRFGAGCPSVDLSASIDHIYAISPDNFLIDGKPVVSKVLVLLDDLHELTKSQRRIFLGQNHAHTVSGSHLDRGATRGIGT